MLTLYGIKNCSTMKKAMTWLDEQGLEWQLHDYRKDGIEPDQIQGWLTTATREVLVNRRGMTWRQLDDTEKSVLTDGSDAEVAGLLAQKPTLIKRPVVPQAQGLLVGFREEDWTALID